jgi:hypothetical protein
MSDEQVERVLGAVVATAVEHRKRIG